jgi:hypothetical protein
MELLRPRYGRAKMEEDEEARRGIVERFIRFKAQKRSKGRTGCLLCGGEVLRAPVM